MVAPAILRAPHRRSQARSEARTRKAPLRAPCLDIESLALGTEERSFLFASICRSECAEAVFDLFRRRWCAVPSLIRRSTPAGLRTQWTKPTDDFASAS